MCYCISDKQRDNYTEDEENEEFFRSSYLRRGDPANRKKPNKYLKDFLNEMKKE